MTEVAKPAGLAARGGAWFQSYDGWSRRGARRGRGRLRAGPQGAPRGCCSTDLRRRRPSGWRAGFGVAVEWDDTFPGYRRCYIDGPHGNRLELMEPLEA